MNPTLLRNQFDRLARDPGDVRLLKQLAVEFGSAVVRGRPEWLREYRVAAASALRAIEATTSDAPAVIFARGVLSALLDAAGCAEETLTAERDREDVRAVASRPVHRAALRALEGQALNTTALADKLGRQKSQMSEALRELEAVGLICALIGQGGDGRSKPYRLTLTGLTLLDTLPIDEGARPSGTPELPDWVGQLDVSIEKLVTEKLSASASWVTTTGARLGHLSASEPAGAGGSQLVLSYALFNTSAARPTVANQGERPVPPALAHRAAILAAAGV